MAKEVTVLGIEGAFLRGVRLEERNGAFTCTDVESWPLGEESGETTLTAEETAAVATAVVGALDDGGRSSSVNSAEMTVETVVEEDKPLARALRAAVKHFEQSEFTLSLPLSKLLVKSVRMPVEAREDFGHGTTPRKSATSTVGSRKSLTHIGYTWVFFDIELLSRNIQSYCGNKSDGS